MKKVYLVTSGEYSDYGIDAVFTSRKKAEAYRKNLNKDKYRSYTNEIEEWELNPPNVWGYLTRICIDREGNSWGAHTTWQHDPQTSHNLEYHYGGRAVLVCSVRTNSEKRAIKVANEIRTQLVASGEWDRQVEAAKKDGRL